MAKFDWNQFPAEDAAAPEKPKKFDWNQFPAEQEKGAQVYDKPAGPEQASAVDRFVERVQDPQRWKAIATGEGPYAEKVVQGTAPLVTPGGALPRLAKAATALSEGKGLGYLLGRTALSTGQGAVMSAVDGKEGESWQDKLDRAESGAKLSGGIQLAAESIPVVGKALGYAGRKIGQAVSGVDESLIQNYAGRTDEVNDLIKQSGGDITEAADRVRTELADGIQGAKSRLNSQISRTLESASPEASVSIQPIVDRLEAAKAKLNPNFKSGAIAEIDEMIASIGKESKDGKVNVKSLYQIKQFLNEGSASAYNKGGQIFSRASEAARAAKDAAGETRTLLKPVAGAISEADGQLSKLHAIERRLNKNMLAAGKPDAALVAAGSGANPRNAANLRELERISGVPVSQRAKDLATAKVFANPSLSPTDWTGKAAARVLLAGGAGTALAGPLGGAIGAGLASPLALKVGINALSGAKEIAARFPSFAKFTRENPIAAQTVAQLVSGQIRRANPPAEITPEVEQYFQENPKLLQDVRDEKVRVRIERAVAPKRGEDRWAQTGLQKLGIDDPALTKKLLESKEGRRLLIEASDLPAGSQAMKRIQDKIQKGVNYGNESISGTPSEVLRRERKPSSGR